MPLNIEITMLDDQDKEEKKISQVKVKSNYNGLRDRKKASTDL